MKRPHGRGRRSPTLLVWAICVSYIAIAAPAAQALQPAAVVQARPAGSNPDQTVRSGQAMPGEVTRYTLSSDRYRQARSINQIRFWTTLVGFVYGVAALWLVLRRKLSAKYRTLAESVSRRRFVQALVFTPPLILTIDALELPLAAFRNWIFLKYGLSIQGWGSWFWDWIKNELVTAVIATIFVWLLYAIIRRSRRRWWFYFWLASLPMGLALVFLQPLVIDPLFFKFEPLAQKEPALTESLEQMVQRAGEDIPPQRMFWMGAGEKLNALNAYVTGFGESKRIVVWDTTIRKMTSPQIVYVAGHEMGHYVLWHIPKLLTFGAALLFVLFYLGFRTVDWVLARWGASWDVRGLDDWASLPALLILISVFYFFVTPGVSAISRHYEEQADQYGLEVTHGFGAGANVRAGVSSSRRRESRRS